MVVLVGGSEVSSEDLRAACARLPFGSRVLAITAASGQKPSLRRIGDADVITVGALDELPFALQKVLA